MSNLTIDQVSSLKDTYIDFVKLNGILYKYYNQNKNEIDHVPFALFPYQINKNKYEKLRHTQLIWGNLLHKLSNDRKKCNVLFQQTAKTDPFVRKILELYNKTIDDNPQKNSFHILRADYMLDQFKDKYLLIQFNTIAVSFGPISQKIQKIMSILHPIFLKQYNQLNFSDCNNIDLIGNSIAETINYAGLKGIVIFIVSQIEGNIYDQRYIEFCLVKYGFKCIRKTLKQLSEEVKFDEISRNITYDNENIALFYFRDGYAPKSYNEKIWELRQKIQRSNAIKIPTLPMQLVNFKKMQQQLSNQKLLLQYINAEQTKELLDVTAKMWNFENQQAQQQILSLVNNNNFVLKPNREGGSNNIYNQQVIIALKSMSPQQRKAYVLMQRIYPKSTLNYLFRRGNFQRQQKTISEISIFSVLHWNENNLIKNEVGGHLVRTKSEKSDEGGVAVGASVINSLYMIN